MNEITSPEQYDLETTALKVPPHSIEAEQAVLGGLMLDNNAWGGCRTRCPTAISTAMTIA